MLREDKFSLAIYGPELQYQQEGLHSNNFFSPPPVLQKSNLSAFLIRNLLYYGGSFKSPQTDACSKAGEAKAILLFCV